MGLSSTTLHVVIQGSVVWDRRAVATGLVQVSPTIGGSVAVGLMGGILAAFVGGASSAILDPAARGSLSAAELDTGRAALAAGLDVAYWLMLAAAGAAWVVAFRAMPNVRLGDTLPRPAAIAPDDRVGEPPAGDG
jgi:hypothetical protein